MPEPQREKAMPRKAEIRANAVGNSIELGSTPAQQITVAKVSGWRLLAALGAGSSAGAGIGTITYFAVHFLAPATHPAVLTQVIVVEVYGLLTIAVALAFRPVSDSPLAFRFTSLSDMALAFGAWLGVLAVSAGAYLLLKPVFGSITDILRHLLIEGTDVKRLQGQPMAAWAIALPRGCLLAPLFEELFFRGAVLQWFRRYLSDANAILVAAALFAVMHVYPLALPFAFIFGAFTGWIRVRTGSTMNTLCMHICNNLVFLGLGFWLLR